VRGVGIAHIRVDIHGGASLSDQVVDAPSITFSGVEVGGVSRVHVKGIDVVLEVHEMSLADSLINTLLKSSGQGAIAISTASLDSSVHSILH